MVFQSWSLTIGVLVIIAIITWDRKRKTPFDVNPFGLKASIRLATAEESALALREKGRLAS